MRDEVVLLDTPRKVNLQAQSAQIRAILKQFERDFAENHNGTKPSKNDIRAKPEIQAKYKQYTRLQDILAGRVPFEEVQEASPTKDKRYKRQDSGIGSSPGNKKVFGTPSKKQTSQQVDVYDAPWDATPKRPRLHAIGPTPHRDGKVLGLFDLLPHPDSEASVTPSSSARKRKFVELYDGVSQVRPATAIGSTPSRKSSRDRGDLLDHLTGTPNKDRDKEHNKHSRTPRSEGRKFLLSQFFATPNTARCLPSMVSPAKSSQTPLRDTIFDRTPTSKTDTAQQETTPAYLKRSISFKDRLLSATQPAPSSLDERHPTLGRKGIGPPTLRSFRSSTSSFTQRMSIPMIPNDEHRDSDSDHEDELDALHEMEGNTIPRSRTKPQTLVDDSQLPELGFSSSDVENEKSTSRLTTKPYKKKGQKRTTRKSTMRPILHKAKSLPTFVAADSNHGQHDQNHEGLDLDEIINSRSDEEEDGSDAAYNDNTTERTQDAISKTKRKGEKEEKVRTINPNAQSHMNFRSLKIKNKNSKAKKGAGGRRFGRR